MIKVLAEKLKSTPRPLVFIAVFFFTLELTARLALMFTGDYVYPPFRQRTLEGREGPAILRFNQRGAIGKLWDGQREQIAILGGSFSMGHGLSLEQSLAGALRRNRPGSHIDVFASVQQSSAKGLAILESLQKKGIFYDFLILEVPVGEFSPEPDPEAFFHTSLWRQEGRSPFHFADIISRNAHRMANYAPEVKSLLSALGLIEDKLLEAGIDSCLRSRPENIEYVDEPFAWSASLETEAAGMMNALYSSGSKVARHIIFLVTPVADGPREHPGVAHRWCALLESIQHPGKFLSKRSFAQQFKTKGNAQYSIARRLNYPVLNLIPLGEEMVAKGDHFFSDHLHLSSGGSIEVARKINEALNSFQER